MAEGYVIGPGFASLRGYQAERYPASSSFSNEAIFPRPRIPLRLRPRADAELEAGAVLAWVEPVADRIAELLDLPAGWDSYGAQPVNHEAIDRALSVLSVVMTSASPAPWIVPLPSGGIQLEWYEGPVEIEIALDNGDSSIMIDDEEIPAGLGLWPSALARIRALLAPA